MKKIGILIYHAIQKLCGNSEAEQATTHQNPVRILHILGNMQRGGTESVVFNYYRAIDKSKVQFDLVIDENSPCDVPEYITNLGCIVYRIQPYTKLLGYISSIKRICKKGRYQIIHSHMNSMSVFSLFAAWLAGVPIRIAHNHSTAGMGDDFKRDLLKYILRPFAKVFATDCFACTAHAGRWLFGERTVNAGNVTIIKNAIDTTRFAYNPETRQRERERLNIVDRFVIGHIGRFSPQKNHFMLISVFAEICKKRDDAVLLLVGHLGSMGGGIENGIRAKVRELGVADKIIFAGTREDVSGLYQAFDVFVLPSLYEGLGMVAVEAQVSGLPCVLSDRVPKEAKILDNVEFLSLSEKPRKWAEALCEAASKRGDYSAEVAKAGYEINDAVVDLTDIYLRLAGAGSKAALCLPPISNKYPSIQKRKETKGV